MKQNHFSGDVLENVGLITFERNLDLKVEMTVMEQFGNVFTQADADDHCSDHVIGMEMDHLSAPTRRVIRAYLTVRTKTCDKKHTWEYAIVPS